MHMRARRLLALAIPLLILASATDAHAGTRVVVGIGGPGWGGYYRPHHGWGFYYAPAPVFVAPAPVVVVPVQPPAYYLVPAQPVSPGYATPAPTTGAPAAPTLPPPPPAAIPTVPAPGK
jgi:hypothetical protein